ncbi:lipid-binding protein [Prevotella koreensis]|uniref:lipid-binding protein n=1 Tax=Prevotella koreensis TaxID=2490854 RepID=UPI0028ECD83F|nr:lipid-binding protein [Prevotella koreensis]
MKKYISMFIFAMLAVFGLNSCSLETDEEAGGTKIEDMAGFWDVRVDVVNDDGTIDVDPFDLGEFKLMTYNTVENVDNAMWMNLDGKKSFWNMKFIIPINYGAKTFSCEETNYYPEDPGAGNVVISEGKVLLKQGHNLHGMPADSIVFKAKFSDDSDARTYMLTGIRHSGFTE